MHWGIQEKNGPEKNCDNNCGKFRAQRRIRLGVRRLGRRYSNCHIFENLLPGEYELYLSLSYRSPADSRLSTAIPRVF
jgi:hypothetical protein